MSFRSLAIRRNLLLGLCAVLLLVAAVVVLNRIGGSHAFNWLPEAGAWAYLATGGMGDAVFPVLPGETTLNAASALASQGSLHLSLVMVAGAVGAILGDPTDREGGEGRTRVAFVMSFVEGSAPMLIVAGRYVPGLRFAINATMGVSEYPYVGSSPGRRSAGRSGPFTPAASPTSSPPRSRDSRSLPS